MESNERIAKVETKVDNLTEDVKEIKGMLTRHIDGDNAYHKEIRDYLLALDKRYSGKWVERMAIIIIGILITVGLSFIPTTSNEQINNNSTVQDSSWVGRTSDSLTCIHPIRF